MSRTDNHRPYWLRAEDAGPVECHDHRFGECDLPEERSVWHGNWNERPNCYWEASKSAWYSALACSCSMCSPEGWDRTKSERAWRKELELEENPRRAPAKKNTKRWCRGKEGREHIPMISDPRWGFPCQWRPAWGRLKDSSNAKRWSCSHHEICSTCGKELRYSIQRDECPEFRKMMGYDSNS
jgi:hypothetical protein